MKDLEVYMDAALVTLRASFPAALTAENAKHTDFQLPAPGDSGRYLFGGEDEADEILSYPAIVVAIPDRDLSGFSLGQQDFDARPIVVVQGWVEAGTGFYGFQALYRGALRYGRALLNTLLVPDAFGQGVTVYSLHEHYGVNPQTGERSSTRLAQTLLLFTLDDVDSPG